MIPHQCPTSAINKRGFACPQARQQGHYEGTTSPLAQKAEAIVFTCKEVEAWASEPVQSARRTQHDQYMLFKEELESRYTC